MEVYSTTRVSFTFIQKLWKFRDLGSTWFAALTYMMNHNATSTMYHETTDYWVDAGQGFIQIHSNLMKI